MACSSGGSGGVAAPAGDDTPGSKRVRLAESGYLIGPPFAACTTAPGPGDRWCAFTDGAKVAWAVNISASGVGPAPACDGTDARCRRLGSDTVEPPQFIGEYARFASLTRPADPAWPGTELVWHPSWPEPKPLTGPKGGGCDLHPVSGAVVCTEATTSGGDQVLRRLGRIAGLDAGLPSEASALSDRFLIIELSPRGNYVVAQPRTPGNLGVLEPHPLRVVAIGTPNESKVLAESVLEGKWAISKDESRIYFLKGQAASPFESRWDLMAADFPSGMNPRLIRRGIRDLHTVVHADGADRGLLSLERGAPSLGNTLRFYSVVGGVESPLEAGQLGVDEMPFIDDAAGALIYLFATAEGTKHWVAPIDLSRPGCGFSRDAWQIGLLPSPRMLFWTEKVSTGPSHHALYTAPVDDCTAKRTVSEVVHSWRALPEKRGVVFTHGQGLHFVPLDEAGAQPRRIYAPPVQEWVYEPATNTLLLAGPAVASQGVFLIRDAL